MTMSRIKQKLPLLFWLTLMLLLFGETVLLAMANWQNKDAGDWNGNETHQVLSESPWSKTARLNSASEVTVRWQSALPVRLALSKAAGGHPDAANMEDLGEYVIAVSGIPSRSLRLFEAANGQRDKPGGIENQLRSSTALWRGGRDPIYPAKVEVSPFGEARVMLFYFPKGDPIELADKEVEFRLTTARMGLKRKFALRDMTYQGKLQL